MARWFLRDQPPSPTRAGHQLLERGSGVLAQAAVNPPPPVWGGSCLGPWASQAGLAGPESAGQGSSKPHQGQGWGRRRGRKQGGTVQGAEVALEGQEREAQAG